MALFGYLRELLGVYYVVRHYADPCHATVDSGSERYHCRVGKK